MKILLHSSKTMETEQSLVLAPGAKPRKNPTQGGDFTWLPIQSQTF